tara:strand:+ start:3899 stop:4312 length:414 start_codon:yes stop_codon:yes gene_type:complete
MAKENTKPSTPNKEAELMARMGITADQVQAKETKSKVVEINTNADKLKLALKEGVKTINSNNGKLVSFNAIKRDGFLKDANGKPKLDENDKKIPKYVKVRVQGYFTIDKTSDGFFQATKGVQYTENYTIAEFTELEE